jgi:anthraniloyl-CoA monooxygenase
VHAYQYDRERSTFIVEAREETWRAPGWTTSTSRDDRLLRAAVRRGAEGPSAALQSLDLAQLSHHPQRALVARPVCWPATPAHTAHFSVGSGTKLAMEDAIALAAALSAHPDVPARSPPTKPRAGRRSRACNAPRRRVCSGSRTPSATWISSPSSSRSRC